MHRSYCRMPYLPARGTHPHDLNLMSEKQRRVWQRKRIIEGECDNYINFRIERRRSQCAAGPAAGANVERSGVDAAIEEHGLRSSRRRRARSEDESDSSAEMPPAQRGRMMTKSERKANTQKKDEGNSRDAGGSSETALLQPNPPRITQMLQTMCDKAVTKYGLKRRL